MRDRRGMDQILVIEELVLLGGHEVTVETEELPVGGRVVNFDGLERRLEALELARRAHEETGVFGQVLGKQARLEVSIRLALRHHAPRGESPGTSRAAGEARPAGCGKGAPPSRCCRWCSCTRRRRWSRSRARARCESRDEIRREGRYRSR